MKGNMKKYKGTQSLWWEGGGESSGFFLGPKGISEFFQVSKPQWRGLSPEHI